MATRFCEIYKCEVCGNIIEVIHPGAGHPVCCGAPMALLQENSIEASLEKHVPIVETTDHGITVKVGSVPHPMTAEHFIEWIEIIDGAFVERYHLKPGAIPQALFQRSLHPQMTIRAYCNLHGLWKK